MFRAYYYALIYSCYWDKPELFAAWSQLLSTVPSISELEHELIFEKQSLSGYENCVDSPIVSGILGSFDLMPNMLANCPSGAFISLWYSIVKINAITNRSGKLGCAPFILAFSFAKTAKDKKMFAGILVERYGPEFYSDDIFALIYDPTFIKKALSHPIMRLKFGGFYFAYSVMHNIPEPIELFFRKYWAAADERRALCDSVLEAGLIPPAFKTVLSEIETSYSKRLRHEVRNGRLAACLHS